MLSVSPQSLPRCQQELGTRVLLKSWKRNPGIFQFHLLRVNLQVATLGAQAAELRCLSHQLCWDTSDLGLGQQLLRLLCKNSKPLLLETWTLHASLGALLHESNGTEVLACLSCCVCPVVFETLGQIWWPELHPGASKAEGENWVLEVVICPHVAMTWASPHSHTSTSPSPPPTHTHFKVV